jgi:hypothetical protein
MAPAARNSSQGPKRAVPIRSLLRLVNAEEQEEGRVFGREEIAAITADGFHDLRHNSATLCLAADNGTTLLRQVTGAQA